MKYIEVKSIKFKVDDEDFSLVSKYNWHLDTHGYPKWLDNPNKKMIAMHRLITNCPKGMVVDHINGDITDNRRINLRICTVGENIRNQKKQDFASSVYKGVSYHQKRKQWSSKIYLNRKMIWLGWYDNEIEAARTYNKAAVEYHGKYARLNVI